MRADLVLIARVLVDVRRHENGEPLLTGGQGDGTLHLRAGALGRVHDFLRGNVYQTMIECLEANPDALVLHLLPTYTL